MAAASCWALSFRTLRWLQISQKPPFLVPQEGRGPPKLEGEQQQTTVLRGPSRGHSLRGCLAKPRGWCGRRSGLGGPEPEEEPAPRLSGAHGDRGQREAIRWPQVTSAFTGRRVPFTPSTCFGGPLGVEEGGINHQLQRPALCEQGLWPHGIQLVLWSASRCGMAMLSQAEADPGLLNIPGQWFGHRLGGSMLRPHCRDTHRGTMMALFLGPEASRLGSGPP